MLYSGDDAVSGQDLRPRRPPNILRARTDAARRRGPRDHPLVCQRDRRSPRRQPGHRRAHRRAAQRAAEPEGQDRLGRGPPVLRAQAAHGTAGPLRDHPPVRRPLGVPAAQPSRLTTSSAPATRRRRSATDSGSSRPSASPGRTTATSSASSATAPSRAGSPSRPSIRPATCGRRWWWSSTTTRCPFAPTSALCSSTSTASASTRRSRGCGRTSSTASPGSRPSAARRTGWARTSRSR